MHRFPWTHLDDIVESFPAKNLDVPEAFQIDFSTLLSSSSSSSNNGSSSFSFLDAVLDRARSVAQRQHAAAAEQLNNRSPSSSSSPQLLDSPHSDRSGGRGNSPRHQNESAAAFRTAFFDPAGASEDSFWALSMRHEAVEDTTTSSFSSSFWSRCVPPGSARRRFREIAQHVVRQLRKQRRGNNATASAAAENLDIDYVREQLSAVPAGPARFSGLLRRCHGARRTAILRQLLRILTASAVAGFILGRTTPATTALNGAGLPLFVSLHRLYHKQAEMTITDCTGALILLCLYRGFVLSAHEGRVLLALVSKKVGAAAVYSSSSYSSASPSVNASSSTVMMSMFGFSQQPPPPPQQQQQHDPSSSLLENYEQQLQQHHHCHSPAAALSCTLQVLSEWLAVAPVDALRGCMNATDVSGGLASMLLEEETLTTRLKCALWNFVGSVARASALTASTDTASSGDGDGDPSRSRLRSIWNSVTTSPAAFSAKSDLAALVNSIVDSITSLLQLAGNINSSSENESSSQQAFSLSLPGVLSLLADSSDETCKGIETSSTLVPFASLVDTLLNHHHHHHHDSKRSSRQRRSSSSRERSSERTHHGVTSLVFLNSSHVLESSPDSSIEALWRVVSSSAFRPASTPLEHVFVVDQLHRAVRSAAYRAMTLLQQQQQVKNEEVLFNIAKSALEMLQQNHPAATTSVQQDPMENDGDDGSSSSSATEDEQQQSSFLQQEFHHLLRVIYSSCSSSSSSSSTTTAVAAVADLRDAVVGSLLRFVVSSRRLQLIIGQPAEDPLPAHRSSAAASESAIVFALERSTALVAQRPFFVQQQNRSNDERIIRLIFDAVAVATLLRQTGPAESAARSMLSTLHEEQPAVFSANLFVQQAIISLTERGARFAPPSSSLALDAHVSMLLERTLLAGSIALQDVGVIVLLMQQLGAASATAPFHKSMALCGRIVNLVFSSIAAKQHQQEQHRRKQPPQLQQAEEQQQHVLPLAKQAALLSVLHGFQMQRTLSLSTCLLETVDCLSKDELFEDAEAWVSETARALGVADGVPFLAMLCDLLPVAEAEPFFGDLIDCAATALVRLHRVQPADLAEGLPSLLRGETELLKNYFGFATTSVAAAAVAIIDELKPSNKGEKKEPVVAAVTAAARAEEEETEKDFERRWQQREQELLQSTAAQEMVKSIIESATCERGREMKLQWLMLESVEEVGRRHGVAAEELASRNDILTAALFEARRSTTAVCQGEEQQQKQHPAVSKSSGHVGRLRKLREEAAAAVEDDVSEQEGNENNEDEQQQQTQEPAGAREEDVNDEPQLEDPSPIRKEQQDDDEDEEDGEHDAEQKEQQEDDEEEEEEQQEAEEENAPAAAVEATEQQQQQQQQQQPTAAGSGISAVRGSLVQQWQEEVSVTNTAAEDEIVLLQYDNIEAMRHALRHERLSLQRERKETRTLTRALDEAIAELKSLLDRHSAEKYHSFRYGDQTRMMREEQQLLSSSRSKTKDTELRIIRSLLTRRSAALMELDAALDMQSSLQTPMRTLVHSLATRCENQKQELDQLTRKLRETEESTSKRAKRTDELRLRENDELQKRLATLELELNRIKAQQLQHSMSAPAGAGSQPATARRVQQLGGGLSTGRSSHHHHRPHSASPSARSVGGAGAGAAAVSKPIDMRDI